MSAPSWRQTRARCSPCSVSASTTTCVHASPRSAKPGQQPVGQALRRERGFVDPLRRRVQLADLDQVRRRHGRARAGAPPPRARAGARRSPSAPKRASTAAGGSAANAPRVRSPSRHEHARPAPRRRPPRPATARGTPGSPPAGPRRRAGAASRAANPPSATPARASVDPDRRQRVEHLRHQRVVTAEVARRAAGREREHPGPVDHQPRREPLDRARHRLERARVGRRVELHDRDPRAAGLGFAAPQPRADLLGPRLARRREHPALLEHRDRPSVGRLPAPAGRDHRPVRAPQRQGPGRGLRHRPSPRAAPARPRPCAPRAPRPGPRPPQPQRAARRAPRAPPPAPATHRPRPGAAARRRPATSRAADAPRRCSPRPGRVLRSRARATSRRASPTRTPAGTSATTRLTPSSSAATTVAQRCGGHPAHHREPREIHPRLRARRARRGVPGRSTAAAHSPAAVAAAASPSANDVTPAPGSPRDRHHRPPLQHAPGDERAERTGDGQHAVARQHQRRAPPGHLVEVGAGRPASRRGQRRERGVARRKWGKCGHGHRRHPTERMFDPPERPARRP